MEWATLERDSKTPRSSCGIREAERIGVKQVRRHQGQVGDQKRHDVPLCDIFDCKVEKCIK